MTRDLDSLDSLLATIDQLEADDEDTFSWADAARWCPAALDWADPFEDSLPEFMDDGAVIIVDPARPWVVTAYTPPWWARE